MEVDVSTSSKEINQMRDKGSSQDVEEIVGNILEKSINEIDKNNSPTNKK